MATRRPRASSWRRWPGTCRRSTTCPTARSACAALCETGPAGKRAEWLAKIAENQRRLARWAQSCPANFRHLYVLVDAEVARIDGRLAEAGDLYDEAIEAASEGGFVHDAAVASELAGRHALSRGRIRIADLYLRKARERYARWGAAEKVRALEEEFPEMGRSESRAPAAAIRDSDLDILSLLKSAETHLHRGRPRSAARAARRRVRRGGGRRPGGRRPRGGRRALRARLRGPRPGASPSSAPRSRRPRRSCGTRSSRREITLRPLVVDEAVHDPRVAADPYVVSRAMKSILAVPVQRRGRLVATLYFENNLVTHAFTRARLRVLELLSAQIAAALENSLLFERLKREVSDRRRAEQTVRFLANAGAALAESLDAASDLREADAAPGARARRLVHDRRTRRAPPDPSRGGAARRRGEGVADRRVPGPSGAGLELAPAAVGRPALRRAAPRRGGHRGCAARGRGAGLGAPAPRTRARRAQRDLRSR